VPNQKVKRSKKVVNKIVVNKIVENNNNLIKNKIHRAKYREKIIKRMHNQKVLFLNLVKEKVVDVNKEI